MTNPTPHGQVPEALRLAHIFDNPLPPEWPDMVAAAAELRRQHARIAELEAVGAGGVQALSAAPGVTSEQRRLIGVIADKIEDGTLFQSGIYPKKDLARFVRHMLNTTPTAPAASPTPPAEQQAQPGAVYAGLPERRRVFLCTKCGGRECESGSIHLPHPPCKCGYLGFAENLDFTEDQMRDFADRTHALRMQAATKAAPGVGNSGFDHQTAADFLNGKTVSDEAVRKFVATSRWAHDERAALSAMLLSVRGELASREAEIALLKSALMEAEAAPQQEPAFWTRQRFGEEREFCEAPFTTDWTPLYTAPQPAPENIRGILARCRDFIDTTKAPAYPAGADLADEIDVLLAAQPAAQQGVAYAALWHWLAEYLVGTRTDLDDEIVASKTVNDLRKLVEAAIKQGGKA